MDLPSSLKIIIYWIEVNCRYEESKSKKKNTKKKLFKILKKHNKKTYNKSPFKSIMLDMRSILSKKGCKKNKKKVLNMLKKLKN